MGLISGMAFTGIKDPYDISSVIEYLHFLKIETTKCRPEMIH